MLNVLQPNPEPSAAPGRSARWQRVFVLTLLAILFLTSGFVTFAVWGQPHKRAVIGMGWGLIWLWIIGCGGVMWRFKELGCRLAAGVAMPWPVKFVLGCIMFAMLEEAVTTSMTNCPP